MNEKYLKNVFTSGEASSIAIKSEKFGKYFLSSWATERQFFI